MSNPLRAVGKAWQRHQIRHSTGGFDCLLADRIAMVDSTAWDGLASPHSVFLSRRYLAALERHGPCNIVGRYAMVYRNGQPLAAIAAQRVNVNARQIGGRRSNTSKRKALHAVASPLKGVAQHMLICGNLLSWGPHGLALGPDADDSIIGGVAEALYRMRRAEKLLGNADFVMIKDITADQEPLACGLCTWSYRRVETEPNMMLSIRPQWQTFDDYLNSLTSPYRKSARKVFKDVDAAGIHLARVMPNERNACALHSLYLQVHDAAAIRLFTLPESFLPAMAEALGDDFVCTAAMRGDQMVGFITAIKDNDTAVAYYIGFDRATNANAPVYFRLLYAAVENAIAFGCRRLSFGRTALEPKARLGAKPETMAVYLRHRVPMLNLIVKAAVKGVHHDEAPQRDPFKA